MSWQHIEDTEPRARERHICGLCGRRIRKGAKHIARRGFCEDGPTTFRMHAVCEAQTHDWDWTDWECFDPGEFFHYLKQDFAVGRPTQ